MRNVSKRKRMFRISSHVLEMIQRCLVIKKKYLIAFKATDAKKKKIL